MESYRQSHCINTMVIWGKHYYSHRIYINRCQKNLFSHCWSSQWRNNANFDSQTQAFGIWRKVRKLALRKQNLKASQSLLNSNIRICLKLKNANEKMLLFGKKTNKQLLKTYTGISWPLLFLSSLVISFRVLKFQYKRESFNGS